MNRNERLIGLISYFLMNPRKHQTLNFFSEKFHAGKTSISEDLDILNELFKKEKVGFLERVKGRAGGVKFIPKLTLEQSEQFIGELCEQLHDSSRVLPGGYLYMSDLLGRPEFVQEVGELLAAVFESREIDAVMTVETKGIPLAYAVAASLKVPVIIVRRDPKVTEGPSVSINYVSGSSRKIQTMVLPKRSLQEGMNVCIIDDFMKAGGTINGMVNLLEEFDAKAVAIGVLAEADDEEEERVIHDYVSLIKISGIDMHHKKIDVQPGNVFQYLKK